MAIVTPLIKKPSLCKEDLKNYSPVSGLSFIIVYIQRNRALVAKQLKSYLSRNNMDNINQSAYKSGHSTETALLKIKNDIHVKLSKGQPTALVFWTCQLLLTTLIICSLPNNSLYGSAFQNMS